MALQPHGRVVVLKDELLWEGSTVVTMTKEEQMFLEATKAYSTGKPVMSDEEFNELKLKLKNQGSPIASGGPRCSIRSRRVFTDLDVDYFRLTLLNIPGVAISLSLLFPFMSYDDSRSIPSFRNASSLACLL